MAPIVPASWPGFTAQRSHQVDKGVDLFTLTGTYVLEALSWHSALDSMRRDDFYYDRKPEEPKRDAKTVPGNIERHVFTETRVTAYRLKNAA